jgi:hypothetical protein
MWVLPRYFTSYFTSPKCVCILSGDELPSINMARRSVRFLECACHVSWLLSSAEGELILRPHTATREKEKKNDRGNAVSDL